MYLKSISRYYGAMAYKLTSGRKFCLGNIFKMDYLKCKNLSKKVIKMKTHIWEQSLQKISMNQNCSSPRAHDGIQAVGGF